MEKDNYIAINKDLNNTLKKLKSCYNTRLTEEQKQEKAFKIIKESKKQTQKPLLKLEEIKQKEEASNQQPANKIVQVVNKVKTKAKALKLSSWEREKQKCIEVVSKNGLLLEQFGKFKFDMDCIYAAIKATPGAAVFLRAFSRRSEDKDFLKKGKKITAEIFKGDYRYFKYTFEYFRTRKEDLSMFLRFRPELFVFCTDEIRKDKPYIMGQMTNCNDFWKFVHPTLYADGDFMIDIYRLDKECFDRLDISLRKDKKFMLKVVKEFGPEMLVYADRSLLKNKSFIESVKQDPKCSSLIDLVKNNKDKISKDDLCEYVKIDPTIIRSYGARTFTSDPEFCCKLIFENHDVYKNLPEKAKNNATIKTYASMSHYIGSKKPEDNKDEPVPEFSLMDLMEETTEECLIAALLLISKMKRSMYERAKKEGRDAYAEYETFGKLVRKQALEIRKDINHTPLSAVVAKKTGPVITRV